MGKGITEEDCFCLEWKTNHRFVLPHDKIVVRQGNGIDNERHASKAVNPPTPKEAGAPDVVENVTGVGGRPCQITDSGCLHSTQENISLSRKIIRASYSINIFKPPKQEAGVGVSNMRVVIHRSTLTRRRNQEAGTRIVSCTPHESAWFSTAP